MKLSIASLVQTFWIRRLFSAILYNLCSFFIREDNCRFLGDGSFSEVHEISFGFKKRAMKKIFARDSSTTLDFHREMEILRMCSISEHVVSIVYFSSLNENMYCIMELAEGGDLHTFLFSSDRRSWVTTEQQLFIAMSVLSAIVDIHALGVVHRDIKLENVLITGAGKLKLCDFGLSKILLPGEKSRTVCGSFPYTAPEISKTSMHDACVDMWSIGILLLIVFFKNRGFDFLEDDAMQRQKIAELIRRARIQERNDLFHVKTPCSMESLKVSLVNSLLKYYPEERLGFSDRNELLAHPLFREHPEINLKNFKDTNFFLLS